MASSQKTADFILQQIQSAGAVSARKMFGEYTIYCNGKVVALVADDQLYVKPTVAGKQFLGTVDEKPPYTGAKLCYRISGERWDDHEWLTNLIKLTAKELPLPKTKAKKSK